MNDSLEKFILQNRDAFEDSFEDNQSWKKIEKRLSTRRRIFANAWKVAAILFLVSTFALIVDRQINTPERIQLSMEIQQAEDYYTTLISIKKKEIKSNLSQNEQEKFLSEINQLDDLYEQLKTTYSKNTSNSKIIDAMVENLQLRLDILEKQLAILEAIKQTENETNSDIQI